MNQDFGWCLRDHGAFLSVVWDKPLPGDFAGAQWRAADISARTDDWRLFDAYRDGERVGRVGLHAKMDYPEPIASDVRRIKLGELVGRMAFEANQELPHWSG